MKEFVVSGLFRPLNWGDIIIKLNGKDYPWEAGLTIQKIMDEKKYIFPKIIVKINGQHFEKEDYATTVVNDFDDVQMIHLLAGG